MQPESRTWLGLAAAFLTWLVGVLALALAAIGAIHMLTGCAPRHDVAWHNLDRLMRPTEEVTYYYDLVLNDSPRKFYTVEVGSSAGVDFTFTNVFSITQHDPFCQDIRYLKDGKTNEFHAWMQHVMSVKKQLPPLDPFWTGQSTNRPEQSLEADIRDLRRANLQALRAITEAK